MHWSLLKNAEKETLVFSGLIRKPVSRYIHRVIRCKAIGETNDESIDGTIKEDKLGLDIIYIQAKRWQAGNVVGRPELHKFVGALAGQGAKKGIFITTSAFTKDALSYSLKNETKIVLIDGDQINILQKAVV
ncbi:restriction endonuclease [Arcticibacter tournemirensis]|uniref:restriction endonuclease n=1 Tax=Arcticibacter tournemirensis TaxID=699437 RepID=UPI00192A38F8|nr:restriction endonuclease [Arcticibacter tournemirensis]